MNVLNVTYILPLRRDAPDDSPEFALYLRWLARQVDELIVVDGSPADVYAAHAARWSGCVRHLGVDGDLISPNGKVGGVLTGVRHALHERLVLADDDVRYDAAALRRVVALLDGAHLVRPQNYFDPLPWHARWDTGRTLVNRLLDGDWPGTLALRRSALRATGGYDGRALFENFELVRTLVAAGGIECVAADLFVRRLPPTARHFWSQRTRQAYDEFARPLRFAVSIALLPVIAALALRRRWTALAAGAGSVVAAAEAGRRRGGGQAVFGATAALWSPLWVLERAVCSWLALGVRLVFGGVRYRGGILRHAATPLPVLRHRLKAAGIRLDPPAARPARVE